MKTVKQLKEEDRRVMHVWTQTPDNPLAGKTKESLRADAKRAEQERQEQLALKQQKMADVKKGYNPWKSTSSVKEEVVDMGAHRQKVTDKERALFAQTLKDRDSGKPEAPAQSDFEHPVGTTLSTAEGHNGPWDSVRPGRYQIEKHVMHDDGTKSVPMYKVRRTHDASGKAINPGPFDAHKEVHHLSAITIRKHFNVHGGLKAV